MIGRALFFALACWPMVASAQVRDGANAAARGAAAISGVVRDDLGQPVRRAAVMLGFEGPGVPRLTVSDEAGQFSFAGLAAGSYQLSATKVAYLIARYGASRPGRQGAALVIADGQSVQDAHLIMGRGASISGVIRNAEGEPVPALPVLVLRRVFTLWGRVFVPVGGMAIGPGGAVTDDRGAFRLFGLEPGEYLVSAVPGSGNADADIRAMTAAEVDLAERGLGTSGTPARAAAADLPARPARRLEFAPIYFPGTPALHEAAAIAVDLGQERSGVDFRVSAVPTASVEGTVIRSDGLSIARQSINLMPVSIGPVPFRPTNTLSNNGRFQFDAIVPGEYILTAATPDNANVAVLPLIVTDAGVSGLSLVMRPSTTIVGRIVSDRLTQSRFTGTTVRMSPAGLSPLIPMGPTSGMSGSAGPDGEFKISAGIPGRFVFSVDTLPGASKPPRWFVSSILANGRDVTDTGIELTGNESTVDVVVTLADLIVGLRGRIVDPAGRPTSDHTIVLFPSDSGLWRWGSRRIKAMRPASDGTYAFADVPPGEYLLAAVTDAEPNQWFDADFLNQIRPAALPVRIVEGQEKVQDIQVALPR